MEATFTFINNSRGPIKIKNAEGVAEMVKVGEAVVLNAAGAKIASTITGFMDVSKMAKPAAGVAELRKANEVLAKENADLKAKLAKAEKDLQEALA